MEFGFKYKSVNNVDRVKKELGQQASKDVRAFLEEVFLFLIEKFAEPGRGRTYTFTNKAGEKITYTASAPGDYPVNKTGELMDNLVVKTTVGSNQYNTRFVIGVKDPTTPQGEVLEHKADTGSPGGRHWLSRAIAEHEDILEMKLDQVATAMGGSWQFHVEDEG